MTGKEKTYNANVEKVQKINSISVRFASHLGLHCTDHFVYTIYTSMHLINALGIKKDCSILWKFPIFAETI